MLHKSVIDARGTVEFPDFTEERVYMEPFYQAEGLPEHLSRWQPTVDAMLAGIETDQPIYLMIDQKVVEAGAEHRRPGLHVDGYWYPAETAHGGGGGGWGRHGGGAHMPFPIRVKVRFKTPPKPSWDAVDFSAPEAIILASNVSAARGFVGSYDGRIGDGGDCSTIDTSGLEVIPMMANRVYAGNVCNLHESLPVSETCERTLVRLNVPGWSPK